AAAHTTANVAATATAAYGAVPVSATVLAALASNSPSERTLLQLQSQFVLLRGIQLSVLARRKLLPDQSIRCEPASAGRQLRLRAGVSFRTGRPSGSLELQLSGLLCLSGRELRLQRVLRRPGRIQLLLPRGLPPGL